MKDPNESRPGFKKTKLGWIPQEWKCAPAGTLFDIQLGKMLSKKARIGNNPQPYLANYNVRWGMFDISDVQEMDFNEKEISRYKLQRGDLLVCEGGEVGRCAVWQEQINPCYYQKALHRVRSLDGNVDIYFIMYFLHLAVTSSMMVNFVGQSSISHFTREKFLKFPIALPPLTEQKKVAKILSTWDTAINQTQKLISLKNRRKKAMMNQLLFGKKRLKKYKIKWKSCRLGELVKQVSCPIKFDDGGDYDLISIRRGSGGIFRRGLMPGYEIKTKQLYKVREGDFLLSKMQILHGATSIVSKTFNGCIISGSYIALRIINTNKLDVGFLDWLSKTPFFYNLAYLSSYGVHIEKMTFNLKLFLKSYVRIPNEIEEQKKIAQCLDEAMKEIEVLNKKLEFYEKQKRGLMQRLLTGEVRVNP